MECDICLLEWDSSTRVPRLLNCGHTFCEKCLQGILKKSQASNKSFTCPTCLTEQDISTYQDISSLIKNFNLLRISNKVDKSKTGLTQGRETLIHDQSPIETAKARNAFNNSITSLQDLKHRVTADLNRRCPKHNWPIHSYVIGTNILLCNECLKGTHFNVNPLPHIINEVRMLIDSNGARVCLLKNQIERLQLFFESYLAEFEKANGRKIETLFDYFNQIVKYYHNRADQMLNQCVGELKLQVNEKLKEIIGLQQELGALEQEICLFMNEDDILLLDSIDRIKKIEKKLSNFINYELEFDLLTMNIGLDYASKDKLINAFEQAYHVDLELLSINNAKPTIGQVVKSNSSWPCLCGELNNSFENIKCSSCGVYRRYETIPSFFAQPNLLSEEELAFVGLRKKAEEEEYQRLTAEIQLEQGVMFAIDAKWLNDWYHYAQLHKPRVESLELRVSSNKRIGVLPPGPICNWSLIEKGSVLRQAQLRKSLRKEKDYCLVSQSVWRFFSRNYKGGPEIRLVNLSNIYDERNVILSKNDNYSQSKERYQTEVSECKRDEKVSEVNYELEGCCSSDEEIIDNYDEDVCEYFKQNDVN